MLAPWVEPACNCATLLPSDDSEHASYRDETCNWARDEASRFTRSGSPHRLSSVCCNLALSVDYPCGRFLMVSTSQAEATNGPTRVSCGAEWARLIISFRFGHSGFYNNPSFTTCSFGDASVTRQGWPFFSSFLDLPPPERSRNPQLKRQSTSMWAALSKTRLCHVTAHVCNFRFCLSYARSFKVAGYQN